jgi:hypothetical protein
MDLVRLQSRSPNAVLLPSRVNSSLVSCSPSLSDTGATAAVRPEGATTEPAEPEPELVSVEAAQLPGLGAGDGVPAGSALALTGAAAAAAGEGRAG